MEQVLENMIQAGTPMGILSVVVVLLFRILQQQNTDRINSLERRSEACEKDRIELRKQLHEEIEQRRKSEAALWEKLVSHQPTHENNGE